MHRLVSVICCLALCVFAGLGVFGSYWMMRISLDVEPGLGATYALLSVFTALAASLFVVGAIQIGLSVWPPRPKGTPGCKQYLHHRQGRRR
jgi:hypothetical protein